MTATATLPECLTFGCVYRGAHQSRVDNLNTCTDRCEAHQDQEDE